MNMINTSIRVTIGNNSIKAFNCRKSLQYLPKSSFSTLDYTERQARLGRPVSPHVTIYGFPITAVSSILVRVTGASLSCGFAAVGALGCVGADIPALFATAQQTIPFFSPASKFIISFPFLYHYFGGVRHLFWDNFPSTIETKMSEPSSWGIISGAVALSLASSFYTIENKETANNN